MAETEAAPAAEVIKTEKRHSSDIITTATAMKNDGIGTTVAKRQLNSLSVCVRVCFLNLVLSVHFMQRFPLYTLL